MNQQFSAFSNSNRLRQRAHVAIPGGAHTYAKGDDQYPLLSPGFIARGEGCRVWDVDGNEFIEYGMGNRAVGLGHAAGKQRRHDHHLSRQPRVVSRHAAVTGADDRQGRRQPSRREVGVAGSYWGQKCDVKFVTETIYFSSLFIRRKIVWLLQNRFVMSKSFCASLNRDTVLACKEG